MLMKKSGTFLTANNHQHDHMTVSAHSAGHVTHTAGQLTLIAGRMTELIVQKNLHFKTINWTKNANVSQAHA